MSDPDARLSSLRQAIDDVDRQLVDLLVRRAQLAAEVGEVKAATDAPVYRPEREAAVLRHAAARARAPLGGEAVQSVFREVISVCRALERLLVVAYLGPPGTFSELAMQRQFGARVDGLPCGSIDDVFRAVEGGRSDYGVVPVENSTEGAVNRTLDLLLSTSATLVAEVSLPVQHHLLTRSGSLDGVARVAAHPQALAQCAGWLDEGAPGLPRVPAASNAAAARLASEDPAVAAIAGDAAAARYGLAAVARDIQDDPHNRTRFVVLGRQQTDRSGQDKTSLILSVPNRAGAVHELLAPLARHGVSMTRFESRPARSGAWEYYFYVDIEGHRVDPRVADALAELRGACAFFKCLGSYPVAL